MEYVRVREERVGVGSPSTMLVPRIEPRLAGWQAGSKHPHFILLWPWIVFTAAPITTQTVFSVALLLYIVPTSLESSLSCMVLGMSPSSFLLHF